MHENEFLVIHLIKAQVLKMRRISNKAYLQAPSLKVKWRRLASGTGMNELKWKRFREEKENSLSIFTIWWF